MELVSVGSLSYRPPVAAAPDVALGRAFARAWHERSDASSLRLREAIGRLVDRLHAEGRSPEESVIALKLAVRRFGGMHADPSLAEEHHVDGEECAAIYAEAFTAFVNAYYPAPLR